MTRDVQSQKPKENKCATVQKNVLKDSYGKICVRFFWKNYERRAYCASAKVV